MIACEHTALVRRRVLVGLAVLWGFVGLLVSESWAGDNAHSRQTLRGLPGVVVLVWLPKPTAQRIGLSAQQLESDTEVRLRQAGIRVLTESKPLLYVEVHVLPVSGRLPYTYDVRVAVRQPGYLVRDASIPIVADTWEVSTTGRVRAANSQALRASVRDLVERFIDAYFSVNPRPTGSAAPSSAS